MLASGLALCLGSADVFVRGASRLAARMGIPRLTIGLTVVAFGTSAPELAVSVRAAMSGDAGIALGNLVGSNIVNVWLVLGIAALIAPISIHRAVVRAHVPILIAISSLALGLLCDSRLDLVDCILLLVVFGAYIAFLRWKMTRTGHFAPAREPNGNGKRPSSARSVSGDVLLLLAGLGGLLLGAHWAVRGSVHLAAALGVRSILVGLTVVAVGTSLPEFLTSLVAAIRGEGDIAVGNVIGSCVFNITFILGISGLAAGSRVLVEPSVVQFAMPVMVAGAAACLLVFFTGRVISRWEGGLFLLAYGFFLAHEILATTSAGAALGLYTTILRMSVAGVCILLALSLVREALSPRRRG